MLKRIYCVHDVKSEAFLEPFFAPTDAVATRSFGDCVNNPQHPFGQHPADYTLFRIGEWNDSHGAIIPEDPISCGNGVEHIRNQEAS